MSLVQTRICFFLRIMNFSVTPYSNPPPLPNVYDPLLMSWMRGQPVQIQISTIFNILDFCESRGKKEAKVCGKWVQREVALRPGKTFWCAMFFDETSHSHQSTPLSSTHAAKWRAGQKCEIERSEAKSADLCDALVVILPPRDGIRGHVAGINHPAIGPTKNCN